MFVCGQLVGVRPPLHFKQRGEKKGGERGPMALLYARGGGCGDCATERAL